MRNSLSPIPCIEIGVLPWLTSPEVKTLITPVLLWLLYRAWRVVRHLGQTWVDENVKELFKQKKWNQKFATLWHAAFPSAQQPTTSLNPPAYVLAALSYMGFLTLLYKLGLADAQAFLLILIPSVVTLPVFLPWAMSQRWVRQQFGSGKFLDAYVGGLVVSCFSTLYLYASSYAIVHILLALSTRGIIR